MSSDFNFTVASWYLGNVHVKPISTHSGGGRGEHGKTDDITQDVGQVIFSQGSWAVWSVIDH